METITLPPGVWTQVNAIRFIQNKSNQSGIRVYFGEIGIVPAIDTDAYFLMQEFDRDLLDVSVINGFVRGQIYLMPDENMPVDVVLF